MLRRIPEVEAVCEAADGLEALERIERERPDLLLLDIRMPGLDGLSLAGQARELPPIVFTTAYDEYAVRAFEVSAVDYLLKPVKLERLRAALGRVRAARGGGAGLRELLERLRPPEVAPVAARCGGTVRLFEPRTISRFHAEEKYVVFRQDGHEHLLDETLTSLAERLAPLGFLRVHRAELVNLGHVRALHARDEETRVELADGQTAPVSRRFVAVLKQRLGIG
jgi:DNA-binding LytR/AlgR family response regulator